MIPRKEHRILVQGITGKQGTFWAEKMIEYGATVVGDVKFGKNGEWDRSRTIVVQYQGIKNNDLQQFATPGTRKITLPADIATGEIQPFNSLR